MTRDRIQHALDIIYEREVFNLGQADLYPGLVSGDISNTTAFPEWARCHRGLHQAGRAHTLRGQTSRHRRRSGFVHVRYLDWGGKETAGVESSASTRTAKLSSTGTCCSRTASSNNANTMSRITSLLISWAGS